MTTPTSTNPAVMLVEDDRDDQELARLANQRMKDPYQLIIVSDGLEAIEYLEQNDVAGQKDSGWVLPRVLLVDLDMPRMDGLSLLKRLRENDAFRRLPIIMFTTSKADRDVANCYHYGCSSYVVKPMNISGLVSVFETLSDYWFDCVRLPN